MNGLTLLANTAGVRGLVVGDGSGQLLCDLGAGAEAEAVAAATAVLGRQLRSVGQLLGLGDLVLVSVKAPGRVRLLGVRGTIHAVVDVDPSRSVSEVEAALRDGDWHADLPAEIAALSSAVEVELEVDEEVETPRGDPPAEPLPERGSPAESGWKKGYLLEGWLGARRSGAPERPRAAVTPPRSPSSPEVVPPPSAPAPQTSRSGEVPGMIRAGSLLTGSLRTFPLPDLLEFFRGGQRTGTLLCASEVGLGALHLRSGRITAAYSPNVPALGEWLVRRGVLSAPDLRRALAYQMDDDPKNLRGATLVDCRILDADAVRAGLRGIIGDTVRDLMGWVNGQFTFDPDAPIEPAGAELDVELDPQGVLLDIFKDLDEASRR
jgi:hypothetical protein